MPQRPAVAAAPPAIDDDQFINQFCGPDGSAFLRLRRYCPLLIIPGLVCRSFCLNPISLITLPL